MDYMDLKEAEQVLKNNGYTIIDNILNESLNMNQVEDLLNDLEKQNAILTYEMVDDKAAEMYVTRSQYDALPVFEEVQQLSKSKKRLYVTKGIGEDDLNYLPVNAKCKIMSLIDNNVFICKLTFVF